MTVFAEKSNIPSTAWTGSLSPFFSSFVVPHQLSVKVRFLTRFLTLFTGFEYDGSKHF